MTSQKELQCHLVWVAALLALVLGCASCAGTASLPAATRADTVITTAGLSSVRKLVVRGNVTIQTGTGNVVADNRKAGQRQGSAATGQAAESGNASKRSGGPAWYIYLGVGLVGALAWEALSHRFKLPWRLPDS